MKQTEDSFLALTGDKCHQGVCPDASFYMKSDFNYSLGTIFFHLLTISYSFILISGQIREGWVQCSQRQTPCKNSLPGHQAKKRFTRKITTKTRCGYRPTLILNCYEPDIVVKQAFICHSLTLEGP